MEERNLKVLFLSSVLRFLFCVLRFLIKEFEFFESFPIVHVVIPNVGGAGDNSFFKVLVKLLFAHGAKAGIGGV